MRAKTNGLMGMFLALGALSIMAPATVNAGACSGTTCVCGDTVVGDATLTADLTCASGVGLTIGADGVVLNGNGYALDGSSATGCIMYDYPTYDHIGVYNPGYDSVEIKNLEIKNFCKGVYVWGASSSAPAEYNLIEDNYIHDCGSSASDTNDTGIILRGWVSDTTVQRNEIHGIDGSGTLCISGGNGIFVEGPSVSGNLVVNNCIYDNRKDGILLRKKASSNSILYNEVWENGRGGIVIRCKSSDYNIVGYNCVHDNGGDGIFVGGNYNTVEYNVVYGNTGAWNNGDIVGDGDGIDMGRNDGSSNNALNVNQVCGNNGTDIEVNASATGNYGDNNTCDSTGNYDDVGATGCTYVCPGAPYSCPTGCGPCDDCDGGVCE